MVLSMCLRIKQNGKPLRLLYDPCYNFRTKLIHPWHGNYTVTEITVPKSMRNRGFTLLFFRLRAYDLIIIGIPPDIAFAWLYLFDCTQMRPCE